MNPVSTYLSYRSLQRTQWYSHDEIRNLQEVKLKQLIHHAYQYVPYYTKLFDDIALKPDDINSLADLYKIPITTKADLQAITPSERISSQYSLDELVTEHSSGSTGQPFTTYFDRQFVTTRNNMFLRALRVMGYMPGQKLMLITTGHNRTRPWLRWRYASIESSAANLITQLNEFRPRVLYGCTTPLRLMALHARETGCKSHRPNIVISTAETLDEDTRSLLEDVFEATVYDLYGLTEMGFVAWQCPVRKGYHLAEDTTIIEFEHDEQYQSDRMIMTNLELKAMPLIRYQTGDLAKTINDLNCSCGRQSQRINRIEGRMVDCIRLANDELIPPYRITLALEKITGLGRYQLIQENIDSFTIRIENNESDQTIIKQSIIEVLSPILGNNAQYLITLEESIKPPPGKKFRVIENRTGIQAVNEDTLHKL